MLAPAGLAAVASLALVLALLPGLSLLGRRDRPWTALAGVVVATWLWPAAIAMDVLPDSPDLLPITSFGSHAAAVYAVAVYGAASGTSAWSVPASAAGFGIAVGALDFVAPLESEPIGPWDAVGLAVVIAVFMAIPLLGCWAAGRAIRRRRNRRLGDDGETLAEMVRAAEAAVHTERRRVATGLHRSVVSRTRRMITQADLGRLKGVLSEARSALTAMRELLDTLHGDDAAAPRSPQPTEKTSR